MPERSADDIKHDIERSRVELASAVDQLAYRTAPKRLVENAKETIKARLATPQGQAAVAAVGGVVVILVVKRFRKGDDVKAAKIEARTALQSAKASAKLASRSAKESARELAKDAAKQTSKDVGKTADKVQKNVQKKAKKAEKKIRKRLP